MSFSIRQWLGIAAGATVLGGLLASIEGPQARSVPPQLVTSSSPALVVAAPSERPGHRAQVAQSDSSPPVAQGVLPPGIDAVQWDRLKSELRDRPAELQRVADYLVWSDALRRFRAARTTGADRSTLAALADTVDEGLADRLLNRELTAAEARSIKVALLDATVSDAAQRNEQLAQWINGRPAGAFSPAAPDPRQADFERRQATLLAGQRDPQALARELDALRASVFATGRR